MTSPDNNKQEKLVDLALQLDERLKQNSSSSPDATSPAQPLADEASELSDAEIQELEKAHEALSFLNRVRDHLAQESNQKPLQAERSTVTGQQTRNDETTGSIPEFDVLGRFEIIKPIGQGGFARVFLARDPLLDRDVALKIPKPQVLMSDESRLRFEREAKAVAVLSHPAIIPVYETGSIGPISYIASGYCPGQNLAEWFADQGRSTDLRTAATIVASLAEAVHHAHQRGIVHRDLKPANILVEDGELPMCDLVRITDFGLAKQMESNDATVTAEGAVVGTPAYMSPEQAQGSRQIDAATDIYALGVILYELLTGKLPFQGNSHLETLKSIETQTPYTPRKINAAIPKDLEAICLKCLNKSPGDRYPNAFDLADDLNAFVDGRPVAARHATSIEKLTRWTRRNPTLAAVGTLALVSFVVGLAGTTWQWRKAQGNLATSKSEYERAELNLVAAKQAVEREREQRRRAEKVAEFIGSTYRRTSPALDGRNVKVVDILERSEKEINVIFKDDPQTKWAVSQQLGIAYTSLGLLDDAIRVLQSTRDEQIAANAQPTADSVALLKNLSDAYFVKGDVELSFELMELAKLTAIEHFGETHEVTIECFAREAASLQNRGKYQEAIQRLRSCFELMDSNEDFPEGVYWRIKGQLGNALLGHGPIEEASQVLLEAVTNLERVEGIDHPTTLFAKNNYVNSLSQLNLLDDAIEMRQDLFESIQRVNGPEHPDTLMALHNLGSTYSMANQPEKAVPIFEDCIAKSLITFGDKSPNTSIPKYNLANSLLKLGHLERAQILYEEVYPVYRNTMGPTHWRTTKCIASLADVNEKLGNWSQAAEFWEKVAMDSFSSTGEPTSASSSASFRAGLCQIRGGQFEDGLGKFDDYLEFAPTSEMSEKQVQSTITKAHALAIEALLSQSQFELAAPYAEEFANRALQPTAEPGQDDEFVSTIFLATIYAHLDREPESAEMISKVLSPDSGFSLDEVESEDQKKLIRDCLDKFLIAATRDGSLLGEYEMEVRSILE